MELVLEPRDGYFMKDGRGWTTSSVGRAFGLPAPPPSTICGAVRTAFGLTGGVGAGGSWTDWEAVRRGVQLSGVVALRRARQDHTWSATHRLWPVPADALFIAESSNVHALRPQPLRNGEGVLGTTDDEGLDRLWAATAPARSKPLPSPRWWSDDTMQKWLAGEPVATDQPQLAPGTRAIVQVSIDPTTQAAAESMLFATELTEAHSSSHQWAIGVRLAQAARMPVPRAAMLGGDRRLAHVTTAASADVLFGSDISWWPTVGCAGLRLVVVTPMWSPVGWLLPGFTAGGWGYRGRIPGIDDDLELREAMVPRPQAISGWDMATNSPKATRRLIPAGAVYFLAKSSGRPFSAAEARALWMYQLGEGQDEGLGCMVPGVWHPGEIQR